VIDRSLHTGFARAVCAAKKLAARLDAVADDPAAAVIARRSELLNGAFKAVEHMAIAAEDNLEGALVIIPAQITLGHRGFLPLRGPSAGVEM
jgi:hypothetical protein